MIFKYLPTKSTFTVEILGQCFKVKFYPNHVMLRRTVFVNPQIFCEHQNYLARKNERLCSDSSAANFAMTVCSLRRHLYTNLLIACVTFSGLITPMTSEYVTVKYKHLSAPATFSDDQESSSLRNTYAEKTHILFPFRLNGI